ncbi:sensor histidine kinase [Aquirufa sp. OSTEICH-129V]|uniref:histidine kinase n=1 Tax=Aquirufa avitistagni TaxID=3104728 RepID=A0ABW6D8R2_9BACT
MFRKIAYGFCLLLLRALWCSPPAQAVADSYHPRKFSNHAQYADFDAMWQDWDQKYRSDEGYFSFANVADLEAILIGHLQKARKEKDLPKVVRVLLPLSMVYHNQAKFDQGLPLLEWLFQHLHLVPKHYHRDVHIKLEEEYRGKNLLEKAIVIRQKRIEKGYIKTFWEIYRDCGLYEDAIKDYRANQPFPAKLELRRVYYYDRLGNLYLLNGQIDQAFQQYTKGAEQIQLLIQWNRKSKQYLPRELNFWRGDFKGKLVICRIKKGIYTHAIQTLKEDLALTKDDIDHQIQSMIVLSQCFIHAKQYPVAKIYLDSANRYMRGKVIRPLKIELLATYAAYHKSVSQSDSAFYFLKAQYNYQDSLNETMNRNKSVLLLGQLEVTKRRAELLASKNDLLKLTKISEVQQVQVRSLILLVIIMLVSVLVSIIIIRQKYLLNVRAEQIVLQNSRNEILLKELHHRVKNNLQVIYSLLNLQKRRVRNKESNELIRSMQNRIQTFALVHSNLHNTQEFEFVNVKEYIETLVAHLILVFQHEEDIPVTIQYDIDTELQLSLEKITSFGLILNEIISNAFKYAFTQVKNGILTIRVQRQGAKISIVISDNGPGKESDLTDSGQLGMKLITLMCKQMDATHEMRADGGIIHQITFNYI